LKTEQEGRFVHFNRAILQVVVRQLAPGVIHELFEGDPYTGQAPLQSPSAHAQRQRDILEGRPFAGQGPLQRALNLLFQGQPGIPTLEFALQVGPDGGQQIVIMRHERHVETEGAAGKGPRA
jgi:hypothetical protein